MLKGLTRLHTPELLHLLAAMGHGDEVALVDAHFPAVSTARRLVRLDGADLPDVLDACLQLLPLDDFVPHPAFRMEVVGKPSEVPEVQRLSQEVIDRRAGRAIPLQPIDRDAFYTRSREAFGVIATGEQRPYGCLLLKKGVIGAR